MNGNATTKAQIRTLLDRMPEEVTVEEVIDELLLRLKVSRGFAQIDAGQGVPHDQAKQTMSRWLK